MLLWTSFCTIAYRGRPEMPLPDMLHQVKDAGYDGIELWWPHVERLSEGELAEVKSLASELQLAIPIISPYLGNFDLEMTNRDEMLERCRAAAPVAKALGAPLLRAFAGWTCECSSLTASEDYWQYNLEGFREMAQIVEPYDLEIAIETHSGTLCDSVKGVRRFAEFCGPRIKANLQLDDIIQNSGLLDSVAVYRELRDLVVHVHVPFPLDDMAASGQSPDRREDYRALLAYLRARVFQGFVSIEHCSDRLDPLEVARDGRKMLEDLV